MKKTLIKRIDRLHSIIILFTLLAFNTNSFAQIPRDVPQPNGDPLSLDSPASIIIYIVFPVLLILLYIFLRRRKRNKKN